MWSPLLCAVVLAGANETSLSARPSVEQGWALLGVGDATGAERIASAWLTADPMDLAALRLHLRARARLDGDLAAVSEARAGMAADPRGAVWRLALADALVESWRFDPAWCGEIDRLLGSTPPGDLRFWAHALRHRAMTRRCRADRAPEVVESERQAALALGEPIVGAAGLVLGMAAVDGIDAAEAGWIERSLARDPDVLGHLAALWEAPAGKGDSRARKAALQAARAALAEGSLPRVAAAFAVFEAAAPSDPRASADASRAEAELARLHPDPHRYGPARELQRARRHADPERALDQVDALQMPANDPELRALHASARGDLLWELGRAEQAIEAYHTAWTATPTDGDRANVFAYRASSRGIRLDEALIAAGIAVDGARDQRFATRSWSGESWEAWRERTVDEVGSALDTRGWVLHQLGRQEAAVSDLLDAARLVDAPIVHLHLGLALVALGDAASAAPHLARGTEERDPGEASVVERGRAALRAWWAGSGRWHPGGLDGWIADIVQNVEPAASVFDDNPLVGRTLPPITVLVDGRPVDLSEVEGPFVLDFWATWCRPCVDSLPKVDQLAARHADVRFIAVSVDRESSAVDAFFEGSPAPGFDVGWWSAAGSPYEAFSMSGVPSLFVVGPDRRVATYLFGSDVNRLGEAVEAVSGAPRGTRPGAPGP